MGPQDSEELAKFKKDTHLLKKLKNKQDLIDQMLIRKEREQTIENLEREQDFKFVLQDIEKGKKEKERLKEIDTMQKERNARIWIEQANQMYKGH